MVLSFGGIYGSKVVIIVGRFGIGVREAGIRGDGRHEGVDGWMVKGAYRAEVEGDSLSKPGKSGD